MREILIVGIVIGFLGLFGFLMTIEWETLLFTGIWFTVYGLATGVPTGFVYHVVLYRILKKSYNVPQGWIWRPIDSHNVLSNREKWRVWPWALAGAGGFFAIIIGQVLITTSLFKFYV